MAGPFYNVNPTRQEENGQGTHEQNPSWVVAFAPFTEPTSSYNSRSDLLSTKPLIIVENDCISVTVQNSKANFAKMASLTVKTGEIYYQSAVAPGDWVFIWMHDYPNKSKEIVKYLKQINAGARTANPAISDWFSGLKFIGRVISVSSANTVSENGVKTVTQTIGCQAFLEFATSVYFTEMARGILAFGAGPDASSPEQQSQLLTDTAVNALPKGFGKKFVDFFTNNKNLVSTFFPPDVAIVFFLIIILGIDRGDPLLNSLPVAGSFSDAIRVPRVVSTILNKPGATKLWEILNVYTGLQKFSTKGTISSKPWESFVPISIDSIGVNSPTFYKSATRLKGYVPFYPQPWNNEPLWNILTQYLNPVLNEMFTSFRCSARNTIVPTIYIREKPFGTNLYDAISKHMAEIQPNLKKSVDAESNKLQESLQKEKAAKEAAKKKQDDKNQKQSPELFELNRISERAMYNELPRWIIHSSRVKALNTETSESNRINFVQVWGRHSNINFSGAQDTDSTANNDIELGKLAQLAQGNYATDEKDIERNGLRADISETPFDFPGASAGVAYESPKWARMRADWLFNGHLMLNGTITCTGIVEPIAEGDNLQFDNVLYHIESVTHQASIAPNGKKTFTTTMNIGHGILAASLNRKSPNLPSYAHQRGSDRNEQSFIITPGITDVQQTGKSNRKPNGDIS